MIHLVDPSGAARANSARYCCMNMTAGAPITVIEHDVVDTLPDSLDVAIVAVHASVRRQAIEKLLARAKVRYLILEKFLFPAEVDYAVVSQILKDAGVTAHVNCPRRLWPGYRALKELPRNASDRVSLRCTANASLPIGTSAIHLLDALAFICDRDNFTLKGDRLDPVLISGSRGGVEFTGTLYGENAAGDAFCSTVETKSNRLPVIQLETPSWRVTVDEADKTMTLNCAENGWLYEMRPFETRLQSELTHLVVSDLIEIGRCGLPTFDESSKLHLAILQPLLAHYRAHADANAVACPIT
jgi:predicted dehydrogenase